MPNQIQLKDAEQDQEIALLKHRIEDTEETSEELRQRIRKLEKTVWGASAVVAAVVSLLGLAIAADSKTMEDIPTFDESETTVGVFTDQIRRYEIERERTPAKFVIDKALLEWLKWEQ